MARGFGKTWWGEAWLQALSRIDYSNRLPRGATYARNGYVRSIEIKDGGVTARVAGSRPTPYRETLHLDAFSKKQTDALVTELMRRPAVISQMLNRELPHVVITLAEAMGMKVFPQSWLDMHMKCSCPDWAVPCKHLAAVVYIISQEIDSNPFLIFQLHGVDLLAELEKRGVSIDSRTSVTVPAFADTVALAEEEEAGDGEKPAAVDFSHIARLSDALLAILPQNPAFCHQGDFHARYAREITGIAKTADKLAEGKCSAQPFFGTETGALEPDSRLTLSVDGNLQFKFSTSRGKERPKACGEKALLLAMLSLSATEAAYSHESVQAFRQTLLCALHLLAAGMVVPQIAMTSKDKAAIRWMPATTDAGVRGIVEKLNGLFPAKTCMLAKGRTCKAVAAPAALAVSAFLHILIPALSSGKAREDKLMEMFFHCQPADFSELGEREVPGGIKAWLDHLHLASSRYRPVLIVNDDESHDTFFVDIAVEDTADADRPPIPLHDIIASGDYAHCRFNILREISLLSSFVPHTDSYIDGGASHPIELTGRALPPFLLKATPAMRLLGVKVVLPASMKDLLHPKVSVSISAKPPESPHIRLDQLLSFQWRIAIGNNILTPEEFGSLCARADSLLYFRGNYIYVSEDDIRKLNQALTDGRGLTAAQMLQAALAGEYNHSPVVLTDGARKLLQTLTQEKTIPVPSSVHATLRPYQERGFSWMYRNVRLGFGCIIADDMGLGKTLQVIALLQKMKDDGWLEKKKAVIVVPMGLVSNWQAELTRFAPTLTVFTYHGAARDIDSFDADLLLTTYGITRSDISILKKRRWAAAVIDEAQNIKNTSAAQTKAVKALNADARIAMSGTPVENRLSEYWSIMDFANKGYLGTEKKFSENYAKPIQNTNDLSVAERFRRITAPLMLRRLKTDKSIISDLPDKIVIDEHASLTARQAALYQQTLSEAMRVIEGIDEQAGSKSLFARQGLILQMILALKQICNHPAQFLKNGEADATQSGKTQMLLDLIDSISDSGEKAIIFTQFREMGDLLARFISERTGHSPMFLHGGCSVRQRQEMVERFQTGRGDRIFILSLKAAGTGLNLTAASHVIHYDLWWNPAVEAQATDRAYRIGQKKNVMVHRLITSNTFEERIDMMLKDKQHLADLTVTTGESWLGKLSNKELHEIFG